MGDLRAGIAVSPSPLAARVIVVVSMSLGFCTVAWEPYASLAANASTLCVPGTAGKALVPATPHPQRAARPACPASDRAHRGGLLAVGLAVAPNAASGGVSWKSCRHCRSDTRAGAVESMKSTSTARNRSGASQCG